MNLKSQWILTEDQIRNFEHHRQDHYRTFQFEKPKDAVFIRGFINKFVKFMRRRNRQYEFPFKFEKVIHTAISLFRRYYLVNSFICQDLSVWQALICCLYLSFKLNEFNQDKMIKIADKWKTNRYFPNYLEYPHFGDEEYSKKQISFLTSIRFQIGISKVITPIEAMFHTINKGVNAMQELTGHSDKIDDKYEICPIIDKLLTKFYEHPTLIFLYEGPKIALSIIVCALRSKNLPMQLLGEPLIDIHRANSALIDHIIAMLQQQVTEIDEAEYTRQAQRILKVHGFKKPLPKAIQSPRFQPQRHDLIFDKE